MNSIGFVETLCVEKTDCLMAGFQNSSYVLQ